LITHLKNLAVFLILVSGTIIAVVYVEPYQQVSDELLLNNNFSKDFLCWNKSGTGKASRQNHILRFQQEDNAGEVRVEQKIENPGKYHRLRLSADIKSFEIIPGEKSWHRARLILSSYDKNGKWLAVPHGVAAIEGTNEWRHVERIFTVSSLAAELKVIAMLYKASGTVWFRNMSLLEIEEQDSWKILKIIAILLWVLFLTGTFLPWIVQSKNMLSKVSMFILMAAIFCGTMVPANIKDRLQTSSPLMIAETHCLAPASVKTDESSMTTRHHTNTMWKVLNNSGHFFLFLMLAAVLVNNYPWKIPQLLILMIILAGATELMQFFVDGREPGIFDGLLDLCGAFSGVVVANYWNRNSRWEVCS